MYKLIIVDDEDSIRDGIADCYPWEDLGFEVAGTFTDGKEALNYIERFRADAVLSDVRMPKMDGLELACVLSRDYPSIQTVLLSGYAEFEYAQRALRYGVKEYILKPIQYDTILRVFTNLRESLDQIYGLRRADEPSPGYYNQIVDQVISYLEEHYANASLEEASVLVALSPNYLSKIFKRKTGRNFSEYLLDFKMEKAAELLTDITIKIYEVAAAVGYDNPKNFSRAFKSYYGKTPRQFREQEPIT